MNETYNKEKLKVYVVYVNVSGAGEPAMENNLLT